MKFFVCIALIAAINYATATPVSTGAVSSGATTNLENTETDAAAPITNQGLIDLTRLRKSAYGGSSGGYGGASIQAPPCPKNYLFSCQPNLAPVPCSAPSQSYGSAGAYSSPVASYMAPNFGTPSQQQFYLPQALTAFQY